jgi:hypothetical protein
VAVQCVMSHHVGCSIGIGVIAVSERVVVPRMAVVLR